MEDIELTSDTLITLSQIESGCLFIPYKKSAVMIIKDSTNKIEDLLDFTSAAITTELIERPEFPTIAAYIKFYTQNDESHNFEYYFNVESSQELELFQMLCENKILQTLFYDESSTIMKLIKLDEKDWALMSSVHKKAVRMFDKT